MVDPGFPIAEGSNPEGGANLLLPPANEVCEGYVFRGVCLSTGGGLPHCMLGYTHTPWAEPCLGRHPPWQTLHPLDKHPHPWADTPLDRHPTRAGIPLGRPPPAQCMLGYGQQACGTHPTGMQSCLAIVLQKTAWK